MRRKASIFALAALVAALVTAFTLAPSAAAKRGVAVPASCTSVQTSNATACSLTLVRFTAKNGTLSAVFHLVNQATGQATNLTVPITQQERTTSCMILALTIDRIDRFSVGLHLQTTAIHIGLTAQSGTVLADVLCGLFPGRNPLKVLAAQLTAATHRGEITVT